MTENWLFLTIYIAFWMLIPVLMTLIAYKKYKLAKEKKIRRTRLRLVKGDNVGKVRN